MRDVLRRGDITVEFVIVTPGLAKEWLTRNTHNRPVKGKLESFVRDMTSGYWDFNGDTIRFSADGTLSDGQHRLHAIVESATTQLCLVVSGLPQEAQDTMDQGTKRTHADQFHLAGKSDAALLAAILGLVLPLTEGSPWARSMAPTLTEKKTFLAAHEHAAYRAVEIASKARHTVPAAPSAIGAAYFLCAEVNRAEADVFFIDKVIEQLGFFKGDPAKALLSRFRTARRDAVRMDSDEVIRYCLKAWNHHRSGSVIASLMHPKGGWTKDNFPAPK